MGSYATGVIVGPEQQLRDEVAALTARIEELERRLDAISREVETLPPIPIRDGESS